VLSGEPEIAHAESASKLQSCTGAWEHPEVDRSPGEGYRSVWQVCMWLPDWFIFCWCIRPQGGIPAGLWSTWDLWWLVQLYNGRDCDKFGNTSEHRRELYTHLGVLDRANQKPENADDQYLKWVCVTHQWSRFGSDKRFSSVRFQNHPKSRPAALWWAKPVPLPANQRVLTGSARPVCSNVHFSFSGFSINGRIQISYCHAQYINFGT